MSSENITAEELPGGYEKELIPGKYNEEKARLESFSLWPSHYPVNPIRLAKSGFYYTGSHDKVICFSCNGCIDKWQYGDIVQKKHMEYYPNCAFINHKSNNIPLLPSNKTVQPEKQCDDEYSTDKDLATMSSANLQDEQEFSLALNEKSPSVNEAKSNICETETDFQQMSSLQERMKTFDINWPLPLLDTSQLAIAGFFYLGYKDKVQCAFCHGIVKNWEIGDVPLLEHIRHFPYCAYAQKLKKDHHYLIPDDDGEYRSSDKLHLSDAASSMKTFTERSAELSDLDIPLHDAPIYPKQATMAARLQTFLSWPEESPVEKESLALAGFFYIGFRDHTKCFHCGGGLCNWELHDDPWIEHARWFQNCTYLKLKKDTSFIENCDAINDPCSTHPPKVISQPQESTDHKVTDSMSNALLNQVEKAMESTMISDVIKENVYAPYLVRAAVFQKIKECGVSFSHVDELLKYIKIVKEKLNSTTYVRNFHESYVDVSTVGQYPVREPTVAVQRSSSNTYDMTELTKEIEDVQAAMPKKGEDIKRDPN